MPPGVTGSALAKYELAGVPADTLQVAAAVLRGADVVRVHDVERMARVVRVAEGLR